MFSFGEELRRERERRGIDLGQIAQETNIAPRFLEAIERGQLDSIPGRFYQRAYIRAYAGRLGLDPAPFVAAYEFAAGAPSPVLPPSGQGAAARRFGTALKWMALAIVGLGLSGVAAAVWRRAPQVETPPRQLPDVSFRAQGDRDRDLETMPFFPFVPFVEEELEAEPLPSATVELRLMVNEPCWLEVFLDGERATEGIMLRGFDKEFRAGEICFSLGNAGGVSYWVNDHVGKALGHPGEVQKNICVNSDNVADFVGKKPEGPRGR